MSVESNENSAFGFYGKWQEFLPIAFTNMLLTLVTLGFYRFWGITRERHYLWNKSRFIDDRLAWTGTGMELFIGFIMAVVIFFVPFIGLQFFMQALILQGHIGMVAGLTLVFYVGLLYLAGFAIFRALRYRLSRTQWHGIHGGSDDQGFGFGWSYAWKTMAGAMAMGLLIPWSMTQLWAERWNKMSFGPHRFESGPTWESLMKRYVLCYLAPIAGLILGGIMMAAGAVSNSPVGAGLGGILMLLGFYVALPLAALAYYAAFFREMVSTLSLSSLDFQFKARTKDWILLFLGNLGLSLLAGLIGVLITLPLGIASLTNIQPGEIPFNGNVVMLILVILMFVIPFGLAGALGRYRNWAFFIRHMEATGEVDLGELTQSTTRATSHGEGLFDALDIGAI